MTPSGPDERLGFLEREVSRLDALLAATADPDERLALARERQLLFDETAAILRKGNLALQQENMALATKVLALLQERLAENIDPDERVKLLEEMKWALGILGDSSRSMEEE
jgi:hypothetical protein